MNRRKNELAFIALAFMTLVVVVGWVCFTWKFVL